MFDMTTKMRPYCEHEIRDFSKKDFTKGKEKRAATELIKKNHAEVLLDDF